MGHLDNFVGFAGIRREERIVGRDTVAEESIEVGIV